MKQEKFKISIEREALRISSDGKITSKVFPKVFGKKEENKFISADEDESIFIIKTPSSTSISEAYNKLEEIINVIVYDTYNLKEILWQSSYYKEEEPLTAKFTWHIDKEFYEEMKLENKSLPEDLESFNDQAKENIAKYNYLTKNLYGKIKIKATKTSIQISNIVLNSFNTYGINENDLLFLTTLIFSNFENYEFKDLENSELKKLLLKTTKHYNLKATDAIEEIFKELKDKENRIQKLKNLSFDEILNLSKQYNTYCFDQRYCMQKYKKLVSESVVIIKDAISQGIDYTVLNEGKSTVSFNLNGHTEFVIEGNKTDRDSYIFPIITDDKFVSKQIMQKDGLSVPTAILLEKDMDKDDLESLVKPFYNNTLVVKPRNTNYGTGITVFSKSANKTQIINAINYAFEFDNNVLIEEYKKGMEYRFLVVNGKCLSVAHRRIASVVGDGKSSIKELIDAKNKEPWHYLTGTPVKMDEPVVEHLKLQGYNFETILPKNKRIFLRTNSNCSTGGESIDMTEIMPAKFKKIAEKASRTFDAKICGVDIIINDLNEDEYSIIEINDNPGYSINEWPYEGKGEKIGLAVLKLLNLLNTDSKK